MKKLLRGFRRMLPNGYGVTGFECSIREGAGSRSERTALRPILEPLEARLAPAFTQLPSIVSGTPAGTATGNGASVVGVARTVSADGRYEVFSSAATNLVSGLTDANGGNDVFVRDLLTGVTSLVSINSAGTGTGSVTSDNPTISSDGRYVAFRSAANNLAAPATNSVLQIFRRDLQTNTTILVSINAAGTNGGNAGASAPSLSGDGSRVAYTSFATDMVAGLTDGNANNDIFVRNVAAGTTAAVSVNPAGTATGNGVSDQPIISDDGLSVAFRSAATDLVAASDNNQTNDIFVRSLTTNTTTLISRVSTTPGTIDGASTAFGRNLSNDGRYEVFSSAASDVVAGLVDVNGTSDVFIRDLQTGSVQAVSMNSGGTATANGGSTNAVISGDGRYVAFRSNATNLQGSSTNGQAQIYRWDRLTNTTILASFNSAGLNGGNSTSDNPSISTDGARIAFSSNATDLLAVTDTNGVTDVYVRNLVSNTTLLASVNSAGTATGNATSSSPVICADGSAVAFISQSSNLVAGVVDNNANYDVFLRNLTTNTTSIISIASSTNGTINVASAKQSRSISADGRFEVFSTVATNVVPGLTDTNGQADVFVRDLVNQTTSLVSVNSAGTGPSSGQSDTAVITPDGRYVVFRSNSSDLTAFGGNGVLQLYRRDLQTNTTILVTVNSAGTGLANSSSDQPSISDDGSRVAYRTLATNLVAGVTDSNSANDIAVRDISAGTNAYVSVASSGTATGSTSSSNPSISGNGAIVIFESLAVDLVVGGFDNNGSTDVFVRNLSTSTTSFVGIQNLTAGTADAASTRNNRSISSDGRYHVFISASINMVSTIPDRNQLSDVFLYDIITGTITLVSANQSGTGAANAASVDATISGNGQFVFFRSTATDLTVESTGSQSQVFRWDRLSNTTVMVSLNNTGTAGGNASVFGYSASADGNIVAFDTSATNIVPGLSDFNTSGDVFVRNISAGTTVCASIATGGSTTANGASSLPVISANGVAVAFRSTAVNLTSQTDGNAGGNDVYVRNLSAGTTTLASIASTGTASGNGASTDRMTISDDGTRVAFGSDANNLVAGGTTLHQLFVRDLSTSTTFVVSQSTGGVLGNSSSSDPIISGNGRFVVFTSGASNLEPAVSDPNGQFDVFRRDLLTNVSTTISVNSGGAATGNASSSLNTVTGVSTDGNVVVFVSNASNLVAGLTDTNGAADVFVRNVTAATTVCANLSTTPSTTGNGFTSAPYISDDGSRVIFESVATNLLPAIIDFNGTGTDVFSFQVSGTTNTLLSKRPTSGTFAGNAGTDTAFVSFDGQRILFRSNARTLVDNDTNLGIGDVFLRNLTTSTTSLVSVNLGGTGSANNTSTAAGLTPNGQFALFLSSASDLTAQTLSGQSVFRRDLNTGTTILVSFNSAGTAGANSSSDSAAISDNGNIVAFRTFASNVVAGITDTNGTGDIAYRNISTGTNFLASRDASGVSTANSGSSLPIVSGDGSNIVFETIATNLLTGFVDFNGTALDLYANATSTNVSQMVSVHASGAYSGDSSADSFSISDNGQRVAIRSFAANLVDNDGNGGASDIFVRDLGTSSTILVSVNAGGTGSSNGSALEPVISGDGRYVAFSSSATDLAAPDSNTSQDIFRRDLQTNTTILISVNSAGTNGGNNSCDQPSISANGALVAYRSFSSNLVSGVTDGNATGDVFLRDVVGAVTRMLSVDSTGAASANGASSAPLVSADGSRAIFSTQAGNLLAGMLDYNNTSIDVYAHNVSAATNALVSMRASDLRTGNSASSSPEISANGNRVVYSSNSGNLIDIDLSTNSDVFVRDLGTNTTILVSVNPAGTAAGNGTSSNAAITPDGRYVVFESNATNLTATTDSNGQTDVFRRDLQTNTTLLISVNSAGTAAASGGITDQVVISDDGNFVAFRSAATNVVAGDTNSLADIFVRDVVGNVTTIVSKNGATQSNGASSVPAIAGNGSVVVFLSAATNLVTGATDANAGADLFAGFRDSPLAVDVVDVAPDPRATPVSSVQVVLNRAVNLATFDFNDLTLTLNGGANLITNVVTIAYVSGTTYQINNLFGFTSNAGTYVLTVNMAAVSDLAGNLGSGSASDTWVLTLTQPSVVVVGPVTPDPRNTAVSFVDVVMSEVVNLATFDFNDLALTRNGGSNLIDNTVTVTFVAGTTYRINNLTTLTTPDGTYVLTVDATGIQNLGGANGTGTGSDTWTMDTIAPKIVNVFFNGTVDSDGAGSADNVWSAAFRTAAGNATLGYPAQSGAGQLTSMPWSTIDTIQIQFSENVVVGIGNLGLRGINVTTYAFSNFSYDSVNFIGIWTIAPNIDTDRLIMDLDGDGGAGIAVADPTGNALAGTWIESSSTFPTSGAAAQDFKYRFVVAVGDADRNGIVRNADVNLVRSNLFVDAGQAGYSIFRDIDGSGLTRNADVNLVRSHLFVDPPSGPGPNRPIPGGRRVDSGINRLSSAHRSDHFAAEDSIHGRTVRSPRRLASVAALDGLFEAW